MSIFIVDCDYSAALSVLPPFNCSNPCPFLLWIATRSDYLTVSEYYFGSNPCPFLLWIATISFSLASASAFSFCSNPCPFLLWIATCTQIRYISKSCSSNPCPFLLWIATSEACKFFCLHLCVVTLVHFYCGLRRKNSKQWYQLLVVVTLVHFYCGLRH